MRAKRALMGTNRFLSRLRPPVPDLDFVDTPTKTARVSVLSATLCLSVAALMVSGKIVEIADRLPLGADRDRWVAAAEGADRAGNWLSLNRPYDALRELRGAGDDAGQRVDVIGDLEDLLAAGVESDSRSPSVTIPPASTATPSDDTLAPATDSDDPFSPSGDTLEDPSAATLPAPDPADLIKDTAEAAEDPTAATDGEPDTLSGELETTSGALIDPDAAGTEPTFASRARRRRSVRWRSRSSW